ncbi:MAG: hypothetical protein AAF620_19145 [Bacteroidota bacterium]
MHPIYISFKDPEHSQKKREASNFQKTLTNLLSFIFPKANPDFDEKYDAVECWLLEFLPDNEYPDREIGLDRDEKTIVIAPLGKNLGFWLDTDMSLKQYEAFNYRKISKEEFETKWEEFFLTQHFS